MCKFYQHGSCNQGSRCAYAHDPQELRHPPESQNTSMCETFAREGHCANPTCQFAHGADQLRATNVLVKAKMFGFGSKCRNGKSCRFAHSDEELRLASQPGSAAHTGQDGSDSAEGSTESGSQADPRSDHTSNHSCTTIFTGSSGRSRATGGAEGGAGGFNSGHSAELPVRARSREPVAKLSHRRLDVHKKQDAEKAGLSLLADGATTLCISNVPTYFTQGSLLAMFEDLTPAMRGNFDFFHCPWEQDLMRNTGHATINFANAVHAQAFQQAWSNRGLCGSGPSEKRLRVTRAPLQGLQANLDHYSGTVTKSADPRFRPLFRGESGSLNALMVTDDSFSAGGGRRV